MPRGTTTIARRLAAADPRPMPPDDLRRMAAVGAVASIIDVRSPEAFAKRHIPGSINVPETKITALVQALTNHPSAVLVCDDGRCSEEVVRTVAFSGFTNVYYLGDGLAGWEESGGTLVETSERGSERRVGRPERDSGIARIFNCLSYRVVFVGFAASAALVAGALYLFH